MIAMSPTPWCGQWMNRQQILSRLGGLGWHIVYSTGLWYSWDRGRGAWRESPWMGRFLELDNVVVDETPRGLVRVPALPAVDRWAVRRAVARLRRADGSRGNHGQTAYVFHPNYRPYVEALAPKYLVYHAYDLFELTPEWNSKRQANEDWLLEQADLIIGSSSAIAERLGERSGRRVRVLANGADVSAFMAARRGSEVPPDIAEIEGPKIGYVGSLNRKVDFALLAELAQTRPEWQFVLIGPVGSLDDKAQAGLQRCRHQGNVHFLGSRPHRELPQYVAQLDVATMPYRVGEGLWTSAGYPLKLHEYLAADRPTVGRYLPSLAPFGHILDFADGKEEWLEAIERALQGKGAGVGQRQRVAAENDWDTRAWELAGWLNEIDAQ